MEETQKELIPFQGTEIVTFSRDNEHFVALRPVCDAFGIDWSWQFRRLKDEEIFSACVANVATQDSIGRDQEMICLPLEMFPIWLAKLETNRLKNPFAQKLILEYQRLAAKVLYDHFFGRRIGELESQNRDQQKENLFLIAEHLSDKEEVLRYKIREFFGNEIQYHKAQRIWRLKGLGYDYKKIAEHDHCSAGTLGKWKRRYDFYLSASLFQRSYVGKIYDTVDPQSLQHSFCSNKHEFVNMLWNENDRLVMLIESKERELRDRIAAGKEMF